MQAFESTTVPNKGEILILSNDELKILLDAMAEYVKVNKRFKKAKKLFEEMESKICIYR